MLAAERIGLGASRFTPTTATVAFDPSDRLWMASHCARDGVQWGSRVRELRRREPPSRATVTSQVSASACVSFQRNVGAAMPGGKSVSSSG